MTEDPKLQPFEGRPVLGSGIEIPGAAGGLRDSLAIDPFEGHNGDKVFVLLETQVSKIRFDPVKEVDGWKRVHVLDVELGMIVDAELVEDHLARQRARIAEAAADAKAREAGMERIPFDEGDEAAELTARSLLVAAHESGAHDGSPIAGCPECRPAAVKEEDGDVADG